MLYKLITPSPYSLGRRAFILVLGIGAALLLPSAALALEKDFSALPHLSSVETKERAPEISSLEQRLVEQGLVNVRTLDPTIMVDLKYARADNFMESKVYGDFDQAYLRPSAAAKLVAASKILQKRHPDLRLLVADALRPRAIQHKMWQHVVDTPMQPYVANPQTGSMHNHGGAVDVTLFDTKAQSQLDMGTPLDYFGPLAQPRLEARFLKEGRLNEQQLQNRLILREAMTEAGWQVLAIEWWHFDAFPVAHIRRNYSIIE